MTIDLEAMASTLVVMASSLERLGMDRSRKEGGTSLLGSGRGGCLGDVLFLSWWAMCMFLLEGSGW